LFAGVSLEGAGILINYDADEAFYNLRGGHPADIMAMRPAPPPAENLKCQLTRMSTPGVAPCPPPVLGPPEPVVVPSVPPAPPPPPASPIPQPR